MRGYVAGAMVHSCAPRARFSFADATFCHSANATSAPEPRAPTGTVQGRG
ncbi:MAG: hypothetical protein ACKOEO_20630 [Planctomycetaceae bacterium]